MNTVNVKWIVLLSAALAAGALTLFAQNSTARAASAPQPQPHISTSTAGGPTDNDPIFTKVYAFVDTGSSKVPVYATPDDLAKNAAPVREMEGYEWVTVISRTQAGDVQIAQIKSNEWVHADKLVLYRPSAFQGRSFDQTPAGPIAWVLADFTSLLEPDGDENPDAPKYKRYDVVKIYEKALVGDTMWYRIGDNQWCRQQRLAIVSPRNAPLGISTNDRLHGKWISVNLFEQTIAAYEGDKLVYASLVSSGLPKWETVKGLFQVRIKSKSQPMYNAAGDPDLGQYHLEEVPFNMFFYTDYALHGAYWHDGFGYPHSRGCVNLSLRDAKWLFNWTQPNSGGNYAVADDANPGTWVWVH